MPRNKIYSIYKTLYRRLGPQDWWPGDTDFEVMVGAILTQNTTWTNVEKAITNLKTGNILAPKKLDMAPLGKLKKMIKPSGFYNIKTARLKEFLRFLKNKCNYDIGRLKNSDIGTLRVELLNVKGIGPETADSIILYALDKPTFVVDAYTKRIFSRHKIFDKNSGYEEIKNIFEENLPKRIKIYNEFHALIVNVGKNYCRAKKMLCDECPLKEYL